WWRERLAGAPALLELPTDRPRPPVPDPRAGSVAFALPAETAQRLQALSRREGATLFMTLLAGWQVLLGRYAGEEDVVVGSPISGRTRAEVEGLIGFFVNTLVLRGDLSGDPSFRELVGRVREGTLGAYGYHEVPFERVVEEVARERSLAYTPLFQVMFALQNTERTELRMGELAMEPLDLGGEGVVKFDLSLEMGEEEGRLRGAITYRAELWDGATIERMAGHLTRLLEAAASDPGSPAATIPLLGDDERRQLLEERNRTDRPYPRGLCVHDLFAAQARRTPDAVAIRCRGETMSYAELDRRSARLASALQRRGVGPETRVGVCTSRTPELLVALLGVLRAGGAYVPLDPVYPPQRIGWMVEDGGIGLVLTESGLTGRIPEGAAGLLVLDAEAEALSAESEEAPESGVLPENLSHVIFTSGSTGRPKGVMIRHSSTVVLLHWLKETITDEERRAVLFSTSVSFDVSVAEVFGTLCWGGTLVLAENALELAELREEVVHASMVPSAAAELLRMGAIPAGVRTLNLGGEPLPNALAQALYALGTVERVGNLYGPTEDTTYSTYSRVERGGEQVHVGRPVANTRAYVLDAHLQPVPAGVIGELYLSGDGLSRGYENRPELTAERFLPDPFAAEGSRMYRTMDRVRWRPDRELEYRGRVDHQVKIRGFRIEPGEVEAVLREHPEVRESVVVAREDTPGERRLVAYVVASRGTASVQELREHLRGRLPEYMVPSALVLLDALPLSPNGKIDRRALPAPGRAADEAYVPPRDDLELRLVQLWEELLEVRPVGVRDDFFALGGHSLLAVRLAARVEQLTGVPFPVAGLFTRSTVERMAEVLRGGEAPRSGSTLVPIRTTGAARPLFFVHAAGGNVLSYVELSRHLGADQPFYGLRARGMEDGEVPHSSVEEMAAEYLERLRAVQPEGPYRV
ncbi:MAG TPA: amino acid adenylation domain-containing protein, partial [Longimicrobiaceae bacterium]|nr:amino acid adenylation domain-containing protein [Longimicrobiaceae bacterium]